MTFDLTRARGQSSDLTDGLEGNVREDGAVVVVEEAFEDVQSDEGQAGVHVGVDGQDHGVTAHHATRANVALQQNYRVSHVLHEGQVRGQSGTHYRPPVVTAVQLNVNVNSNDSDEI